MLITGEWDTRPLIISLKPNCLTVSLDDPSHADVFSYDLEGRPWTTFIDGIAYRRGLDGRILARWRPNGGERKRRWLEPDETAELENHSRQRVAALYQAIQSGTASLRGPISDAMTAALRKAANFDQKRSRADTQRYHQIYKPVGILPPDQYMAVVLQATEGCSFKTCTFCTFYKDRPFRIKSPDEFRQHAQNVRDFLGEGLSLRRTIFLGDANALVVPMKKLLPLLDIVHAVYDVEAMGGIYAFLDGFSGEKKSVVDYTRLHQRGVKTVYVGLESGSPNLLQFLHKPGTPEDAITAVRSLKAAGIAVGVIILLGAGGHQYADEHIRDTITALNAMHLDLNDIIYFSELVVDDTMPYAQDADRMSPLTPVETLAQQQAIEAGLHFSMERGTPHISRYDIREFIY